MHYSTLTEGEPLRRCFGVFLAVLVATGLSARPAASQDVRYSVSFQGNWTLQSTPGGVVSSAHFTTLIGAVHASDVTFWAAGSKASAGVEGVAELGATSTFRSELQAAGTKTKSVIQQGVSFGGTGSATFNIDVSATHPRVTLLSMIGPSPDWFVGVSGTSLLDDANKWRDSLVVDLFPYDAGTEEGTEFSLSNPATNPQENIASIKGTGKFSNVRMARLTFIRVKPSVTLSASPNPVDEGKSVTVTARLSAALSDSVWIPLTLTDGTADDGDYGTLASIKIDSAGTTGTGTITTTDDADTEDETFTVALGTLPSEVKAGTPSSVVVTIRDGDEPPSVTLSASPNPVDEGSSVTVTARLSAALAANVTIPVTLTDGTADDGDYGTLASIEISGGQTTGTGTITTADDADTEDETFTVALGTLPSAVKAGTPSSVVVTIRDGDEPPPSVTLSASPNPVDEGQSVTVTARLSAALAANVTIPVTLTDGTADDGDYGTLASITISDGETSGTGTVSTTADADPDHETFTVSLGTLPPEVTAGDPSSVAIMIRDADGGTPPPFVNLSASPNPVDEGQTVTVTARLSAALADGVTIPLTLTNGTAEDGDYESLASITVNGGQTSGTGTISTAQDADEEDETFTVALGTLPSEVAAGSPSSVAVTIRDDDKPPAPSVSLSASPNPVGEGRSVTVTARLSAALADGVTIPLVLTPGSAEAGDYGTLASIAVGAGETTGTGTISTAEDADEEDETFTVALAALPSTVTAGSPSSVEVTIIDDDAAPPPAPNSPPTVRAACEPCAVAGGGEVRLSADASDPDGDALAYQWSAAQGTFTGATDEPEALWTAPDRVGRFVIRVAVDDGQGGTAADTVTVEVVNRPPMIESPPRFELAENRDGRGTPVTLGRVRATDPDGDDVEFGLAAGGERFVIDAASGALSYVGPGEDFEAGPNRYELTVTAADPHGGRARAEAAVHVLNVNEHPSAGDDTLSAAEDRGTTADVLANDDDPDYGDRLRVVAVGKPGHGRAEVVDDGAAVRYAPDPNYHGQDRFTYVVADAGGLADTAAVEVTVTPVNDAPEAEDDQATTAEDQAIDIPVLDNDTDIDGDRLGVLTVSYAEYGATRIAADGASVSYVPDPNYHGPDRFTYVVADAGGLADTAAVEVTVVPVNDGPAAVGTIPNQALDEGGDGVTVELTPFFADVDGDALTFGAETSDRNVVTAEVRGTALVLAPVVHGDAVVTVTATDPDGLAATQRVTVGVSDRHARAVLSDAFAAMARSYLSSARMTLQRRAGPDGGGAGADAGRSPGLRVDGRAVALPDGHSLWDAAGEIAREWLAGAGTATSASDFAPPDIAGAMSRVGLPAGVSGSSFDFGWGAQPADSAPAGIAWSLWGQTDVQRYEDGAAEPAPGPGGVAAEYDGSLRAHYLGLDAQLRSWLFGVALGRSRGTGDWNAGSASGRLSTSLTSVHPYLRWSGGATTVWTTFGAGWGEAENERTATGRVGESPLDLSMGLVDFRRRLGRERGAVAFGLRADAGWASLSTGEGTETIDDLRGRVHQARLGLDVRGGARLGGTILAPFGAVHMRHDGGDGRTGRGMELSGGFRAQVGIVSLDAQGRWLAFHSATGYAESGAGLTLTVGGRGEEGFSLSASPRWGGPAAGGVALWQDRAPGMPPGLDADPAGWAMDARAAYRTRLGDRLLEVATVYDRTASGHQLQLVGHIGLRAAPAAQPSPRRDP